MQGSVLIANQNETIVSMKSIDVDDIPTMPRMIPKGTPVWSKSADGKSLFVLPKANSTPVHLNGVLANDVRYDKGTTLSHVAVVTGGVASVYMYLDHSGKQYDIGTAWRKYLIIKDDRLMEYRLVLNHGVRSAKVAIKDSPVPGGGSSSSSPPPFKKGGGIDTDNEEAKIDAIVNTFDSQLSGVDTTSGLIDVFNTALDGLRGVHDDAQGRGPTIATEVDAHILDGRDLMSTSGAAAATDMFTVLNVADVNELKTLAGNYVLGDADVKLGYACDVEEFKTLVTAVDEAGTIQQSDLDTVKSDAGGATALLIADYLLDKYPSKADKFRTLLTFKKKGRTSFDIRSVVDSKAEFATMPVSRPSAAKKAAVKKAMSNAAKGI